MFLKPKTGTFNTPVLELESSGSILGRNLTLHWWWCQQGLWWGLEQREDWHKLRIKASFLHIVNVWRSSLFIILSPFHHRWVNTIMPIDRVVFDLNYLTASSHLSGTVSSWKKQALANYQESQSKGKLWLRRDLKNISQRCSAHVFPLAFWLFAGSPLLTLCAPKALCFFLLSWRQNYLLTRRLERKAKLRGKL